MISFFYLFIAGLIGGLIAGLVGIGGGVVYIFILPDTLRLFGVENEFLAQFTIANSLAAIFFASLSANYALIRASNFYIKQVLIIGSFAILSSFFIQEHFVNTSFYSVPVFNAISITLLLYMLVFTLVSAKRKHSRELSDINVWQLSATGVAGGIIASLSGMGGGIIIIPILNAVLKVDIKKASSVSSGAICMSAFSMTVTNLFEKTNRHYDYTVGFIVIPVVIVLAVGVLIASPYGVRTASRLKSSSISYIYAAILSIVIIKKIAEYYYL